MNLLYFVICNNLITFQRFKRKVIQLLLNELTLVMFVSKTWFRKYMFQLRPVHKLCRWVSFQDFIVAMT